MLSVATIYSVAKKLKRNGYKSKEKTGVPETIVGYVKLLIISFIPLINLIVIYLCLFKESEMYENMKESCNKEEI
jgi:hypothetical protein